MLIGEGDAQHSRSRQAGMPCDPVWSCLQVGHMVEKEARLALEQKELVEAQAALHTQVREA